MTRCSFENPRKMKENAKRNFSKTTRNDKDSLGKSKKNEGKYKNKLQKQDMP